MTIPPKHKLPSNPPPPPTTAKTTPPPLATPSFFKSSRSVQFLLRYRKTALLAVGLTYGAYRYNVAKAQARERDFIEEDTVVLWKVYDGSIVEVQSTTQTLSSLLSAGGEARKVQSLPEVMLALRRIEKDDRIRGIMADFSTNATSTGDQLGLAQLEEIQAGIRRLNEIKKEKFPGAWKSVAFTDTFNSQSSYLFATNFEKIYTQVTGSVPLVGLSTTVPFFSKLLEWLGIEVIAEARTDYKSFVQPYISTALTPAQKTNQIELISDLNDNFLTYIARNRFSATAAGSAGLELVKKLTQIGPFSASQAITEGLIDGVAYKTDLLEGIPEKKLKGFYNYSKITEREEERKRKRTGIERTEVGVIYLLGTIGGGGGEFNTQAVIKGLKEAAKDEKVQSVVLRVDSGGGGVVESDSIHAAVREFKKSGKTIVSSYGNASASGGVFSSCHTDSIICAPSTITGSIGVAALKVSISEKFLDRLKLTTDGYFTGSKFNSPIHSLTVEERERYAGQVTEMYDDFKSRVIEGRGIPAEEMEQLAGGRVYAGIRAFGISAPAALVSAIKGLDSVSSFSVPSAILPDPASVGLERRGGKAGLIDGIGGLMDSVSYAHAIHTVKTQRKLVAEQDKALSSADAVIESTIIETEPDLVIKRFPVVKSFWERAREAAQQGNETPLEMAQFFASESLIELTRSILAAAIAREIKAVIPSVAETNMRAELPEMKIR